MNLVIKLGVDIIKFTEQLSQDVPDIKKMEIMHFSITNASETKKIALRFRRENLKYFTPCF